MIVQAQTTWENICSLKQSFGNILKIFQNICGSRQSFASALQRFPKDARRKEGTSEDLQNFHFLKHNYLLFALLAFIHMGHLTHKKENAAAS